LNYRFGFLEIIASINGDTATIDKQIGTNINNATKYQATFDNPFKQQAFTIKVIINVIIISYITFSIGIRFIPIKIITNDNDKYTIAGLHIIKSIWVYTICQYF
jgi:hypothetical protein